jgi:hypothetical protein
MPHLKNSVALSHWELVELAERLMSETPDAERFLPAYDAALAAGDDLPLVNFCGKLLTLALRDARIAMSACRGIPVTPEAVTQKDTAQAA